MRNLYTFLLFLGVIFSNAQSMANYASVRNTGISYLSINLTGSSFASWRNSGGNSQDDNRSDFTNIGFDFWYNGVRYTQFCVSTNGFLDFSTSTDNGGPQPDDFGYQNTAFTNANAANATRPAIAPFYDDLTAQGGTAALGNSLKYQLTGSAPNRTLAVEWISMAIFNNTTPNLNFQVMLVEGTGQILVRYGTMNSGTNTFSYSMGLNGPTVSALPTAAQLKMLQAVNTNNFSNIAQNGLSTMPTASSEYIFTPPVPTAPSGNLTFSGVSQTGMTLNWTNWASNEVGYVIYNSTDNVNFDFVSQTAANATSAAITGLLPSTTYYWRLYAVTEGCLSAAITGTQITSAAGNKVSNGSGTWSTPGIWTPNGVPTAADNVIISNGHVVSINTNAQCNNLTVGQGAATTLEFTGAVRTLTVNNDITVNSLAVFNTNTGSNNTHSIIVEGNIVNNGTINFATDGNSLVNVVFDKNGNQTVSGTGGTTNFNRINVSLGSTIDNELTISSSNFSAATGFLDLTSGTLRISTTNAVNITPFSGATTLSSNTGLWLNSSNLTVNTGAGVTLSGALTVSAGTLNIGNAANEDLASSGGSVTISGGVVNIAGKFDVSGTNNTCDFNIAGGMLVVPTFGSTSQAVAPFHISSAGSQCNMTGGTIVIAREGGNGGQDLGFTNINNSGAIVTGGTLQIGNSSTPASQIIDINTDSQIQNLLVSSANAVARVNTNSLSVGGDITINSGALSANNFNISLEGDWNNAGTFTSGTGTVIFNGSSAQTIFKSGGETFGSMLFTGNGVKTFSAPVSASNFVISSGAAVNISASNHSLTLTGNFVNNGLFTSGSGLVTFNGTTAQTISGSTTTDFFDLLLNNNAGLSLSSAVNLRGALTLNNGTFNANGQAFTLISDATNTARIAQITGTGDYSGNVTIQRYVPGGTTGWALLGSPISSALTLNDWDDDIYISCATCPDGSAGGFISVYTYNETTTGVYDDPAAYVPMNTINDAITPGTGYWVYMGTGPVTTSAVTLDLTGTPRKFNYTLPLNFTNTGSSANDGWNLVTNPYPSAISWAALRGATSNIDNAIYVYNADLNSGTGGFASYVNGISSPAVGAGGIGNEIPMGQGFYVHSTGATALNAQESNKVASNPTFLKPLTQPFPLMRIELQGASNYVDETVLYTQQGASSYFDEVFDSYKMRGQDPNAAIIALEEGTDLFQINGIAPVSGTYTTALRTVTGISGNFTISAHNTNSFPSGACINLYDKFTNTSTDLKTSLYAFTLSDTTSVARFILSITLNPLNVNANVQQPTCEFPGNGMIIANGAGTGPWNYKWTQNGTMIKTSLNKPGADTLTGATAGNYDLMVTTTGACDHSETSYFIAGQESTQASFHVPDTILLYVNPSVQFSNNSLNASASYWDFGTGQDYSNSDSPWFIYTKPGNYKVRLITTSSTGCTDTTDKNIVAIGDITGIASFSVNEQLIIKSFQNNLFELGLADGSSLPEAITLTDASGKLLASYRGDILNDTALSISLQNKAPGIYYLTVIQNGEKTVLRLPVK